MTNDGFMRGMAVFQAAFGKTEFTKSQLSVYRELLSDMPDNVFLTSVKLVCRGRADWYPGSNFAGIINEASGEARTIIREREVRLKEAQDRKVLPERYMPIPEECRKQLLEIVGDKRMPEE